MSCLNENEDHAVITLQLGNYSNYVGAHFWNIQEAGFVYPSSKNTTFTPDVSNRTLYREGMTGFSENDGQPTFTPRLVSVDLKGALGRYIQNFGICYINRPHHKQMDLSCKWTFNPSPSQPGLTP